RPRIFVDVSKLDTRVKVFDQELPFPILLAPTAYHRLVHPRERLRLREALEPPARRWWPACWRRLRSRASPKRRPDLSGFKPISLKTEASLVIWSSAPRALAAKPFA